MSQQYAAAPQADIGISTNFTDWLSGRYLQLLDHPRSLLAGLALLCCLAGYAALDFRFDASSDTLVVEGDPELATYLRVSERFGGDEFLLMTFRPHDGDALSAENLDVLARLQRELAAVDGVGGVFSILDVPLLESPPLPLAELAERLPTLRSDDVDRDQARRELTSSPLFEELLITSDGSTSALRIDLALDGEFSEVSARRAELRAQRQVLLDRGDALSEQQRAELARLDAEHDRLRDSYVTARKALIAEVRAIRDRYREHGELFIGGVPMIAADMVTFVQSDLAAFGVAVVVIVMVVLYWFFRRLRWVLLPMATSAITVLLSVGVLGAVQKPATVVSSNFIALLSIITVSLTIHLIVRYRELLLREDDPDAESLVRQTMTSKFAPCLYNSLTTMVAFASLMASSIVPVEDFGWMMCLGIAIGFLVTFTFFPAVLLLLPRGEPSPTIDQELTLTRALGQIARWRYVGITVIALAWTAVAAVGITRVDLDNRFLEYFREDTDIYQGMHFVDRHLGGTVPFDVVLAFEPYESFDDVEDDFFLEEEDAYPERYWFTRDKIDRVLDLHRFLERQPEVGKVVSVASLDLVARGFTDGEPLSSAEIAGVLGMLPEDLRGELIAPYASPETGQMRLNGRVIESAGAFDRAELEARIRDYAQHELGFAEDAVVVTGMMVMFDRMVKQLLNSQVDTLAWVLLAVLVMFLILLRSVWYAVLGVLPNILAAASVIALMGYAGIPLDMMTITIAAISIGIGVDDAIHYLHRFHEERERHGDVRLAVAFSHATIGNAMYYTTVTIMIGFSVLVLSNFVPTILFGLLTAVAMALALLANLTLLPSLLVLFFGEPRPEVPEVS
ncbi:MAG: MMPL family transporter [Pseudomonadales bacterium]